MMSPGAWRLDLAVWSRRLGRGLCRASRLLPLLSVCVVTGCIVLPIPTGDKKVLAGSRVSQETIARLQIGATSRRQVEQLIGSPLFWWEDERVMGYAWDVRKMLVFWAIGGQGGGDAGVCDIPRHHVLLVQFDETDRVARVGVTVRRSGEHLGDHLVEWWNEAGRKPGEKLLAPDVATLPRTRVIFRAVATVDGKPIEQASQGQVRGGKRVLSRSTIMMGWASFHSGGVPAEISVKPMSGAAGDAGWFEMTLQPEINYLFLGKSLRGYLGHSQVPSYDVIYRLDIPADARIVYGGSLYLECTLSKNRHSFYLQRVRPDASIVKDERESLPPLSSGAGRPTEKIWTQLMTLHEGPPILRTPAGAHQ